MYLFLQNKLFAISREKANNALPISACMRSVAVEP